MTEAHFEVCHEGGVGGWKDACWPILGSWHILQKDLVLADNHPHTLKVDDQSALPDQDSRRVGAGNLRNRPQVY